MLPFGLPRLIGVGGGAAPEIARMRSTIERRWQTVKASEAELNAFDPGANEVHDAGSLGPDLSRRREAQWVEMRKKSAGLSTNGSRVVATDSTDYVEIDHSDLVMVAVQYIVDATGSRARWTNSIL